MEIHVAVAVIHRDGRVLIARRPDHLHQGGLLEFPGGKLEPGESVQAALVREVAEETGMTVSESSLQPLIGVRHDYGDKRVFLDVWETSAATGEPQGREGQWVQWLAPDQLRDQDFPVANRPIIRALNLPHHYAITGPMGQSDEGLRRLESRLASAAPELVLLRDPRLDVRSYLALAQEALDLCDRHAVPLMLHGDPGLLDRLPEAAGVHLPWREARSRVQRPIRDSAWLAVSCHDAGQLAHASALGADFATLGPVQATRSHPGAPVLGWEGFQGLVAGAVMPVYALGGMAPEHRVQASLAGAQGIAGIGYWW